MIPNKSKSLYVKSTYVLSLLGLPLALALVAIELRELVPGEPFPPTLLELVDVEGRAEDKADRRCKLDEGEPLEPMEDLWVFWPCFAVVVEVELGFDAVRFTVVVWLSFLLVFDPFIEPGGQTNTEI